MTLSESSNPLDLSRVMVLLGSFRVRNNDKLAIAAMKAIEDHNSEFRFDSTVHDDHDTEAWMGGNAREELSDPIFALPLGNGRMPKNNSAYILGSVDAYEAEQAGKCRSVQRAKDCCACDFELAEDNQTGISRKALSIDLYPQPNADKQTMVRVGVLADKVMCTTLDPDPDAGWSPLHVAKKGTHFPVPHNGSLLITISWLEFRMWVPKLTGDQDARRRKLAHAFELDTHRNPPVFLPSIHVGTDTRHDNLRIGATKSKPGVMYLYMEPGCPRSTAEMPFFPVWSPPNHVHSAWQPLIEPDSPTTVVEVQIKKVEVYCDLASLLPRHPNVYRFYDVAVYAADDSKCKPKNLPWAIGEFVPENTQTLSTLLDEEAIDKTPLTATKRLSIFQQVCSALSHAHSHHIAHGKLTSCDILVIAGHAAKDPPANEADNACIVKIFGFNISTINFCDRDVAQATLHDATSLGRLGVRLLAACEAYPPELPDENDLDAWIKASRGADSRVQPLLEYLIRGRFTSEHAKHWVSGILIDEPAVNALVEGMEKRSTKRKWKQSRLLSEEPLKQLRVGQRSLAGIKRNHTAPDIPMVESGKSKRSTAIQMGPVLRSQTSGAEKTSQMPVPAVVHSTPAHVAAKSSFTRGSLAPPKPSEIDVGQSDERHPLFNGQHIELRSKARVAQGLTNANAEMPMLGIINAVPEIISEKVAPQKPQSQERVIRECASSKTPQGAQEMWRCQRTVLHQAQAMQDTAHLHNEELFLPGSKHRKNEVRARQDTSHGYVQDDLTTDSESSIDNESGGEPVQLHLTSEVPLGHVPSELDHSIANLDNDAQPPSKLRPGAFDSNSNSSEAVGHDNGQFGIAMQTNNDSFQPAQYQNSLPDTAPWANVLSEAGSQWADAIPQLFESKERISEEPEAYEDELDKSGTVTERNNRPVDRDLWTKKWLGNP